MNPGAGGAAVPFGETIGLLMLVIGILVGVGLGGVWAWLHARVVVAIPEADRRVRTRRFWGLYTATVLVSIGLAVSRHQAAYYEDAIIRVSLWTVGLELFASALWLTLVWYVCVGIPRGLAAMHSASNPGGDLDHGRKTGVAVGVITTITVVISLSSSTYIWSVGGVQPQSGPVLGLGCGSTLLGIAWLVLTIVFLVTINRSAARRPAAIDPSVAARVAPPRSPDHILGADPGK